MNSIVFKTLGSTLILIAVLTVGGLASAHGDDDHRQAAANAEQVIPATAQGIWQSIDKKMAELQQAIQSGSLGNVHHMAYTVRDLVAALPAKATSLPKDKQAAIKSSVKFVATLAERLDASGDANDKVGAQANDEKLKKVLTSLRSNFPGQK